MEDGGTPVQASLTQLGHASCSEQINRATSANHFCCNSLANGPQVFPTSGVELINIYGKFFDGSYYSRNLLKYINLIKETHRGTIVLFYQIFVVLF